MPTVWMVTFDGIDPRRVSLHQLHGGMSAWMGHGGENQPWLITPLSAVNGRPALWLTTFDEAAEAQVRAPGAMRFGAQVGSVASATPVEAVSYRDLLDAPPVTTWRIDTITPMTFRSGRRSMPMPTPGQLLRRALSTWADYADVPLPAGLSRADEEALVFTSVGLRTEQVFVRREQVPGRSGRLEPRDRYVSAGLGSLVLDCDRRKVAQAVAPLMAFLPYCGVGAYRRRGLGHVEVVAAPRSSATVRPGRRSERSRSRGRGDADRIMARDRR